MRRDDVMCLRLTLFGVISSCNWCWEGDALAFLYMDWSMVGVACCLLSDDGLAVFKWSCCLFVRQMLMFLLCFALQAVNERSFLCRLMSMDYGPRTA
ncbi:hypothetical protein F5Y18DRAFT_294934 [Xylariaceae sp. FL1019]|nr:hypothetical protein F5Y18DRAFT_294934 [Xylariaceae sp. FL1019]